ncbi:hypothetical protein [Geopsychrobacter electrodiphilus]|uniref:hypothetical protein n=1 Tax=Geopsychrobacter electrodiphilus TaxID=225196 RepID=UPI00037C78BB|nr:hypothetical protein [Geopsychrobacter electrodiphilus]
MKKIILGSIVLVLGLSGLGMAATSEDGASLLDSRCSVCHSADRAKEAKKTEAEWDATVSRMMSNGAQLTPAEKKTLVDYLSKTYKP